jgi:hypothetical protein
MAVGTPQAGLQSELFYGITTSGSTAYTQVNLVENIDGPGDSTAVIEVGILGQQYKNKLPGQSDAGEVTFTLALNLHTDTTHQFIAALQGTQTVVPWKILYPDTSFCTFNAFLSNFAIKGAEPDTEITADVTVTLTGGAAFTN